MRAPKPEKEDPAVVAAREAEQRRAETARTSETQALLLGATLRRQRRTGKLPSGGGVPLIAPASAGTMGSITAGSIMGAGGASGGGFGGDSSGATLAVY